MLFPFSSVTNRELFSEPPFCQGIIALAIGLEKKERVKERRNVKRDNFEFSRGKKQNDKFMIKY